MFHLFINGLAASAGGGLTYLRNVIPHISERGDLRCTVALQPGFACDFKSTSNLTVLGLPVPADAARRFLQEQSVLPDLIRCSGADVLLSAGNFALRRSPVPQILLSRNSLYTSDDFYRDLRRRREYRAWADTRIKSLLAKRSIGWADCTVAPSRAFADELRRWTGRDIAAVHHGFDHESFFRDAAPLPSEFQTQLEQCKDSLKLLFVSHYNYYRNFETLFRAVSLLRTRMPDRKLKLILTCRIQTGSNPGSYRAEHASALLGSLGITENVVQFGTVPYHFLHHVYRAADIYVSPAYAESFAHPLVEAMASGLPIAASDLPVHREICGSAALYFERFSPEALAAEIEKVLCSSDRRNNLTADGLRRSHEFSWKQHLQQLLLLAESLIGRTGQKAHAAD